MTDPINSVSGTHGTSAGGHYSGGSFSGDRKKKEHPAAQADVVEISQDAREKAGGRKKKGLLEYLLELLR